MKGKCGRANALTTPVFHPSGGTIARTTTEISLYVL
jgi:hypothetical protein